MAKPIIKKALEHHNNAVDAVITIKSLSNIFFGTPCTSSTFDHPGKREPKNRSHVVSQTATTRKRNEKLTN